MNVVFVTRNELGRRCIMALADIGATVSAIYTRPDSEEISDQIPFDDTADRVGAAFHETTTINGSSQIEQIEKYDPDLLFVVGWSRLVSQQLIDVPNVAALGMHPTPLPRGRGRAPVAWNLIKGYSETMLSMFELVEEADAGDIYGQHRIPITEHDDAKTLNGKIYDAGEELIRECYPDIADGTIKPAPQDDSKATWWPRRRPSHGIIDWNQSAEDIHNWIRGQTHPYPGAYTYLDGKKVTVWGSEPPTGERVFAKPGEIVAVRKRNLAVAAWEEIIELTSVQLPKGPEIPAAKLIENHDFVVGDTFDSVRDSFEPDSNSN